MDHCTYASPVGMLQLTAMAGRLIALRFIKDDEHEGAGPACGMAEQAVFDLTRQQLDAYFARKRERFDVPIALRGTPFQLRVWGELRRIGFGQTLSYRALAERVGQPGAYRAVGTANAANPLGLVVPCHRVIASDGTLAGFAGGVAVKRALLDHERAGAGLFALACG